MATITKTHTFKEGDRTHTQIVSIDFDDKFMTIQHNGEEIALSTTAFQKLFKLVSDCYTEQIKQKLTN